MIQLLELTQDLNSNIEIHKLTIVEAVEKILENLNSNIEIHK